jgi:hypothetical protein
VLKRPASGPGSEPRARARSIIRKPAGPTVNGDSPAAGRRKNRLPGRALDRAVAVIRQDVFLPILLFLTFFSGLFWAALIPVWELSDERVHYGYIQDLGEGVDRFMPDDMSWPAEIRAVDGLTAIQDVRFDYEFYQPYRPDSREGPQEGAIEGLPHSLRIERNTAETNTAKHYPPGYYFAASLVYRVVQSQDVLTVMFSLRAFSAFLTTLTMLFTYLTLKRLFADQAVAKATALIIALSPMYVYFGMAVNVDIMVFLLYSIYLYLLTRAFTGGLTMRLNLLLALTAAFGLWTKQTFMMAVPFYFVLLLFMNLRGTITLKQSVLPAAVFLGTLAVANGWLYLSGAIVSSPESVQARNEPETVGLTGFIRHMQDRWIGYRWVFDTFWGNFGGGANTPFQASERLRIASRFGSALAFIGLLVYFGRAAYQHRFRVRDFLADEKQSLTAFFFVITCMFVASLVLVNYLIVADGEPWVLQARYFFPFVGPIVGLQVLGLTSFLQARWYRHGVLLALVVGVALSHTDTMFRYIIPHYYT